MILKSIIVAALVAVIICAVTGDRFYRIGRKFVGIFYNYPEEKSKSKRRKTKK